jgi:hypothetical protein
VLTELLSVIALIVAALGYYENRRSNNIQLRQAIALEESNRIALGQGAEMNAVPSSAPAVFIPSRWPVLSLFVLLLMNFGVTGFDYYERHYKLDTMETHAPIMMTGAANRSLPVISDDVWDTIHWRNILTIRNALPASSCLIRISATKDNLSFRNTLAYILTTGTGCQLVELPEDTNPELLITADIDNPPPATPTPIAHGLTIHWNKGVRAGEVLFGYLGEFVHSTTRPHASGE